MMNNKLRNLKVAIIHDTLTEYGGAERVLKQILNLFPNADLFTSIISDNPRLKTLRKNLVQGYRENRIFNRYGIFSKLIAAVYWESLDLSKYDIVISSSDEFSSKSVKTKPGTFHICYCHTPPRFLYPEGKNYQQGLLNFKGLSKGFLLNSLMVGDFIASKRPDVIISNSKAVKARINKYYRKDSVVIYPPVNIPVAFPRRLKIEDYYLYIGALDERKNIDLAIRVFNKLNKRLLIIGNGRDRDLLEKMAHNNIKFLGYVEEDEKIKILKKARGFIFPSVDEDFGMAPVEAMAHGVPVIAHQSGGLLETIIDNKTGIFFKENSEISLMKAIIKFEKMKFSPKDCYSQAKKFSVDKFNTNFLRFTAKEYENYQKRFNFEK